MERAEKVCSVLNINNKLKMFGELMYSDFDDK